MASIACTTSPAICPRRRLSAISRYLLSPAICYHPLSAIARYLRSPAIAARNAIRTVSALVGEDRRSLAALVLVGVLMPPHGQCCSVPLFTPRYCLPVSKHAALATATSSRYPRREEKTPLLGKSARCPRWQENTACWPRLACTACLCLAAERGVRAGRRTPPAGHRLPSQH